MTKRLRDAILTQIDCALEEGALTTPQARAWEAKVEEAGTDGELAQVCNALTAALWE